MFVKQKISNSGNIAKTEWNVINVEVEIKMVGTNIKKYNYRKWNCLNPKKDSDIFNNFFVNEIKSTSLHNSQQHVYDGDNISKPLF